jgi:hypothetical protein
MSTNAQRAVNTRNSVDLDADTYSGDPAVPYLHATLAQYLHHDHVKPLTLSVVLYGGEKPGASGNPPVDEMEIPGEYLDDLIAVLEHVRAQRDSLGRSQDRGPRLSPKKGKKSA